MSGHETSGHESSGLESSGLETSVHETSVHETSVHEMSVHEMPVHETSVQVLRPSYAHASQTLTNSVHLTPATVKSAKRTNLNIKGTV